MLVTQSGEVVNLEKLLEHQTSSVRNFVKFPGSSRKWEITRMLNENLNRSKQCSFMLPKDESFVINIITLCSTCRIID